MARSGICCLEGEWEPNLRARTSVEPQLRMLETLGHCADVIRRDVATKEEFAYYLGKWKQKQYARYSVGYFAFHGSESTIHLGKDALSLEQIAEMLGTTAAKNRILYFGACRTMAASDADLLEFVKRTGVRAVLGYTKDVDWLESAAFDFILLPMLLGRSYPKTIYTALQREHGGFVRKLGFRLVTRDFVSPRRVARDAARSA